MLFFKSKQKSYEILPPPPPFPTLEFEEEQKEKPKFFDEISKPKKAETFPEEKEFGDLVKKVEELKPKKMLSKREKTITKSKKIKDNENQRRRESLILGLSETKSRQFSESQKSKSFSRDFRDTSKIKDFLVKQQFKKITQPIKVKVKKAQPIKIIQVKSIKENKIILRNPSIKQVQKPKSRLDLEEEDFLKDIDFELPKELEKPVEKGIELPEILEDFDVEKETKKPKEILEAEEEIKSAIENIKKQERPSILKRLFSKNLKEKTHEKHLMLELPAVDDISKIHSKINEARQALMKFDLETAKENYIEAMRLYNNISPEEKAKVYNAIKDLYFERKNAEDLKV